MCLEGPPRPLLEGPPLSLAGRRYAERRGLAELALLSCTGLWVSDAKAVTQRAHYVRMTTVGALRRLSRAVKRASIGRYPRKRICTQQRARHVATQNVICNGIAAGGRDMGLDTPFSGRRTADVIHDFDAVEVPVGSVAVDEDGRKSAANQRNSSQHAWVIFGFVGFGSVLGAIAGASETAGVGQTLLTGLLGFIGGGALSVVTFIFNRDEGPRARAAATGQALLGLSMGVWLGLAIGIAARIMFSRTEEQRVYNLYQARQNDGAATLPSKTAEQVSQGVKVETAGAPAPKQLELLHANLDGCEQHGAEVLRRIRARYYERMPEFRIIDEDTLRRICGSP
jgi:hypothetical protein